MANEIQSDSEQLQNSNPAIPAESPFTPEQRFILGKAYRLILSWQPEPRVSTTVAKSRRTAKTATTGSMPAEREA
jgi:hypothetical protein